jgi:predicted permease
MTTLLQDLRYAVRMLGRSPGFTAVAVATLALGIGANTAIFSLVDAVLLRPLPFPEANRIVTLGEAGKGEDARHASSTSYLNFLDWKAQSRSFEAMTIFNGWQPALTGSGEAERLPAAFVTAEVFDVLRVRPVLGRAMRPEENRADAPNVAVVSHGFWQRRMGGGAEAVGRTVTLNGQPFTVIGVLPAGFRAAPPELDVELWANNSLDPHDTRGSRYLRALGRLKAGVTLPQARAEMKAISARLEAEYPKNDGNMAAIVLPLRRAMTADTRAPLLLMGAATLPP